MPNFEKRLVELTDLRVDSRYQSRVDGIDEFVVEDIIKAIVSSAGDDESQDLATLAIDFTNNYPLTVFQTEERGADIVGGFHRREAVSRLGAKHVWCLVAKGTKREAELWALTQENRDHGNRLTLRDHQYRIRRLLEDPEWRIWGDQLIAQRVGVHRSLVGRIRKSLGANTPLPLPEDVDLPPQVVERVKEITDKGGTPRVFEREGQVQVTDVKTRQKPGPKPKPPEERPLSVNSPVLAEEDELIFEPNLSDRFKIKDSIGQVVPGQLKDVFDPATGRVAMHKILIKNLDAINERICEAEHINFNPWLSDARLSVGKKSSFGIKDLIQWSLTTLKNCAIYALCPICKDAGNQEIGCVHCENKGYVPKFVYEELIHLKEQLDEGDVATPDTFDFDAERTVEDGS